MTDGRLLFCGTGGITWFNPADIDHREWNATVNLTAFTINGVPVDQTTLSGSYQVTDSLVSQSQHFELDYSDNSFAVRFSTLTFDDAARITYLYSINGDPFVSLQQGTNEITFSRLPPAPTVSALRLPTKAQRQPSARLRLWCMPRGIGRGGPTCSMPHC